jgi:hypothetical protein
MQTPPWVLALLLAAGCSKTATPAAPAPSASGAPAAPGPTASALAVPDGATACGELGCLQFDSPEAAFQHVLATGPRVVAVGEAHAQKGKEGVASSTRRFTDNLLPLLQGKASDLVLELMMPNPQCKKKTEQVREKQKVVTDKQQDTNQNEYVKMGEKARAVGIVPDLLRPSCADLEAIDQAGPDAIALSLSTIARLTREQVVKLLDRNEKTPADAGKMIVTYGGVLHNDLQPPEALAEWSFGPQLRDRASGSYVEVDMFVPEFIDNTDTWRKLEWFQHFDRDKLGSKTTLFRPRPGTFVVIFPMSPRHP